MIDNFKQIEVQLAFPDEDSFYFVQVIQRKKDNPGVKGANNSSRLIKGYYITSVEHLEREKEEIVLLTNHYNARAGVNLNRRSFRRIAFQTLQKISDQMMNDDYKSVRRAYNSACGQFAKETDKRWIIDIDDKSFDVKELAIHLYSLDPVGRKAIMTLDTPNGFHVISSPFNIQQFREVYPDIDIHKNNPTILYTP
jgi:hypothetical protein